LNVVDAVRSLDPVAGKQAPVTVRRATAADLALVAAHDGAALERFFGFEALARAEHAAGDTTALAVALREAQDSFDRLDDDDRSFCRATLDTLRRLPQTPQRPQTPRAPS
jgi:hypothetical protein